MVSALGVAALLVVGAFAVYLGLRGYLQSDKFRTMLGAEVSGVMRAEGEFEEFQWRGTSAYTASFNAKGYEDAAFSRVRANRVEARVNFRAVWRKVWEIAAIDIGRVDVRVSPDDRLARPQSGPGDGADGGAGGGGFLAGFVPDKVEVKRLGIDEFNIDVALGEARVAGRRSAVEIKPTATPDVYRVSVNGGGITASGYPGLELAAAELRVGTGQAIIDSSEFTLFEEGQLEAHGDIRYGGTGEGAGVAISARLRGVNAEEVLPDDWVKKLRGEIEAQVEVGGGFGAGRTPTFSGVVTLEDGVLEAVPVLDRIDEMLGSSRFRRLSFSEFRARFERGSELLEITDFYAVNAGAAALKGRGEFTHDGAVQGGAYMLGVTPQVTQHLPLVKRLVFDQVFRNDVDTAFAAVFGAADVPKPPEGYRWAVVRILPGAPDPYSADLREQFINAGGLAIWAELSGAAEVAVEALGVLADAAREQGIDVLTVLADGSEENGGMFTLDNIRGAAGELGVTSSMEEVLEDVGGAVGELPGTLLETGAGLLQGFLP